MPVSNFIKARVRKHIKLIRINRSEMPIEVIEKEVYDKVKWEEALNREEMQPVLEYIRSILH